MNSFSQGVFIFKHGYKNASNSKKKRSKYPISTSKFNFDQDSDVWLREFQHTWTTLHSKVNELQENNTDHHLDELFRFVGKTDDTDSVLPTCLRVAALLTGINKPDHFQYFKLLSHKMKKQQVAQTVFLPARDCPNVRTAIETLVAGILNDGKKQSYRKHIDLDKSMMMICDDEENAAMDVSMEQDDDSDDSDDEPPLKLRRNQYTLDVLEAWYEMKYANRPKPKLAIIMPNFEEFKPNVIKDLTLILSNHCKKLPFVLILGVATSLSIALKTFSFNETNRIKLREFTSDSPNHILNNIHDSIILTPTFPFQMTSNVFEYLKSIFIFYDLTTKHFLKAVHYNMMRHYSQGNAYALCAITYKQSKRNIRRLGNADFETIRRLPSFRPYVESMTDCQFVLSILTDDEFLRKQLPSLVHDVYGYFYKFYGYIRFIWRLVKDLPNAPLGKRLSDIYIYCHSSQKPIQYTEEFRKCWQTLAMMSKNEFIILLRKCCDELTKYEMEFCDPNDAQIDRSIVDYVAVSFNQTKRDLDGFIDDLLNDRYKVADENQKPVEKSNEIVSRQEFYRNMLEQKKQSAPFDMETMHKILDYIKLHVIGANIASDNKHPPLIELFVYSDCDYLRAHLRGSSRSAIHKALTNPNYYLQCACCVQEDPNQLIATMPDISIAYRLLLESGQQVNIYDWMMAFNTIVNSNTADDDDNDDIPADIQARFTRARADLQFFGFTKNSKRKTDHVTRTTW